MHAAKCLGNAQDIMKKIKVENSIEITFIGSPLLIGIKSECRIIVLTVLWNIDPIS